MYDLNSVRRQITKILNDYCFANVWNETESEYLVNLRLKMSKPRFISNIITDPLHIDLPTRGDQYALYELREFFLNGGLKLPPHTWYSGMDILDQLQTEVRIYDKAGRLIPFSSLYVYFVAEIGVLYIAVKKEPLLKIFGYETYKDLFLTIYKDSDQVNRISCSDFFISHSDRYIDEINAAQTKIRACLATNKAGTIILINGYEFPAEKAYLSQGDYVSVLLDQNVVGEYTVDVSNFSTGYLSEKTKQYNEIIHCPKVLNPNNKLITFNTCRIFVRSSKGRGEYLHMTDKISVGQITHNDFRVSTNIIDAHRDYLNDMAVTLHVRVSLHNKDNVLIRDSSYLEYLYDCGDETIINFLRGKGDPSLPFWKASYLEDSLYTGMMFDSYNGLDKVTLDQYIKGLGYYTVTSILCRHNHLYKIGANFRNIYKFEKPFIYQNDKAFPLVYANERKIPCQYISHTNDQNGGMTVRIKEGIYLPPAATLSTTLVPGAEFGLIEHAVDIAHQTITVPYRHVNVFLVETVDVPLQGYTKSVTTVYKPLPVSGGTLNVIYNDNGTTTLTFGISLYGRTVVIQPSDYYKVFSFNVNPLINESKPLIIVLENEVSPTLTVPLMGYTTLDVYINGHFAIEGLDYSCIPLKDFNGYTGLVEIFITNMDYIDPKLLNNTVEIIAHSSKNIVDECGYAFDNKISLDNSLNVWYTGLSQAFAYGLYLLDPKDRITYVEPNTPVDNGSPYSIRTTIPNIVQEALVGYDTVTDDARLRTINAYFNKRTPSNKSLVVVKYSYRVYSPYITAIIKDMKDGKISPVVDPSPSRFLLQFKDYQYLKDRDPTVNPTLSKIDLRYVEVSPTYVREYVDPSTPMYWIIKQLVKLTLIKDSVSEGETYDRSY